MAYTFKNKRLAYDNIANGSAAGQERHIVGGGGIETTRQLIDNGPDVNVSFTANRMHETHIGAHSSNNTNPADIPGSTSNTSFYTSGTSITSVFPERL